MKEHRTPKSANLAGTIILFKVAKESIIPVSSGMAKVPKMVTAESRQEEVEGVRKFMLRCKASKAWKFNRDSIDAALEHLEALKGQSEDSYSQP